MMQLSVVLNKVLKAGDYFQVEVCQLSLCLPLDDFIRDGTNWLLLKEFVIRQ